MTMQATTNGAPAGAIMERVVAMGDLDSLKPLERVAYYQKVCESVGLNPLTRPFEYVKLSGKLTLYARRDATDQLRKIHRVSITILSRERTDDLCIVTARATMQDGRTDESSGGVSLKGLSGENLANALMKAETKAKRRVTLSICGLGWLDETEVQTIQSAKPVTVTADGEIVEDLAPKLSASIDWDRWREGHAIRLRGAKTIPELLEAWELAYDDFSKLAPPAEGVEILTKLKDDMKAVLGAV